MPASANAYTHAHHTQSRRAQTGRAQTGYPQTGHAQDRRSAASAQDASGQKKKKFSVWTIVFIVALIVFIAALIMLGRIVYSYWQGENAYEQIAEDSFTIPDDIEGTPLSSLTVDWDSLKATNPDVIGWIYVPGTVINYPIMYSGDDETYLYRDFYGNIGGNWMPNFGAIFLSGINEPDFSDLNNIVYGHNLISGAMFSDFAKFAKQDEFDTHRSVYLLTPQGNYRLNTFAVLDVDSSDPLATSDFIDTAEYTAYVQDKIDRSIVTPEEGMPNAADIQKTFAFVTCDHDNYNDKRYVVYCKIAEYAALDTGSSTSTGANVVEDGTADVITDAVTDTSTGA